MSTQRKTLNSLSLNIPTVNPITLSYARRFYSSMGNPLGGKVLIISSLTHTSHRQTITIGGVLLLGLIHTTPQSWYHWRCKELQSHTCAPDRGIMRTLILFSRHFVSECNRWSKLIVYILMITKDVVMDVRFTQTTLRRKKEKNDCDCDCLFNNSD